jgi:hypothetical protein
MSRPPPRTAVGAAGDRDLDRGRTARRLSLEATAAAVIAGLGEAGITAILLKGPVTARRQYPGEHRPFVDVDLLVPPDCTHAARRWLRGHGFHAAAADALVLRRPGDGAAVDLHVTLGGTTATPERTWRVLARHAVGFDLHGRSVLALDEAAHACHLALHAVQSGNRKPKPRADLDRAVAGVPLPTWARALAIARQLGAEPTLVAALRCYAADGDRLADALGLPARAAFAARVHAADLSAAAEVLGHVGSLPWRQRLRHLRRWIAPRPGEIARRLAQPDTPAWVRDRVPPGARHLALRGYQVAAIARALLAAWREGAPTRRPASPPGSARVAVGPGRVAPGGLRAAPGDPGGAGVPGGAVDDHHPAAPPP